MNITMNTALTSWLSKTAWTMEPPRPYSVFHLSITVAGIILAMWAAHALVSRRIPAIRILFSCGIFLAVTEIYKQLFLYEVVYAESYNWWYFPFQLCSIPMYLCLLLPFIKKHAKVTVAVCTFLADFSLLGGIMALAEPSGLMHPYWTLTLHGLLWHVMLIFIGLFTAMSGLSGRLKKDFLKTLPLLAVFCLIATIINVAAKGVADMFYISPYYPVTQVVFDRISLRLGTYAGIAVYLVSLIAGGFICHMITSLLNRHTASVSKHS